MSEDALVREYEHLARWIARDYFLPGADRDDVEQEAMIGLLRAARDYRPDAGMTFPSFARLCIHRQLITAVKTALRVKHQAFNESRRGHTVESGEYLEAYAALPSPGADPADVIERQDELRRLMRGVRVDLSEFEARCLLGYMNGLKYRQIAEREGRPENKDSIDRALTRARWKLSGTGPPSRLHAYGPRVNAATYPCPACGHDTIRGPRAELPCVVCRYSAETAALDVAA